MERSPLTLQQAQELRDQFNYLVGKPINANSPGGYVITCVAVVPYDEVYKYIFVMDYRECNDVENAISFYEHRLFDVEVISRVVSDKVQIFHKDLRTWLREQNTGIPDISDLSAV
jgi:hypothetical protein